MSAWDAEGAYVEVMARVDALTAGPCPHEELLRVHRAGRVRSLRRKRVLRSTLRRMRVGTTWTPEGVAVILALLCALSAEGGL